MDKRLTVSLAQFCIAQRNAFDPDDWYARFDIDGEAVGLAAKYLSMAGWYGHEAELGLIAAKMRVLAENTLDLYRQSQAVGFDLPYFSIRIRIGAQGRFDQEPPPANAYPMRSTAFPSSAQMPLPAAE